MQCGKRLAETVGMLRSVVVASSLLAFASLVGCAEPVVAEESGESTASQVSYPKTSHDRILDAIEAKANACEVLSESDVEMLESYQKKAHFTFEAYVSFTCSYENGEIVASGLTMEKRAGWSSDDGVFTEQAMDVTASINIPLKAVEVSVEATSSVSVRQAKGEVVQDREVAVSASVSKNLGIVKGTATVSFADDGSVTVSGSGSIPLPISTADCQGGEQSVGATVSLTASSVLDNHGLSDAAAHALETRARKIEERGHANFLAMGGGVPLDKATKAERLKACCDGWKTCS